MFWQARETGVKLLLEHYDAYQTPAEAQVNFFWGITKPSSICGVACMPPPGMQLEFT